MPAARDKKVIVYLEKKEMRLFICGSYAIASDLAVFSVAVKNNKKKGENNPS